MEGWLPLDRMGSFNIQAEKAFCGNAYAIAVLWLQNRSLHLGVDTLHHVVAWLKKEVIVGRTGCQKLPNIIRGQAWLAGVDATEIPIIICTVGAALLFVKNG